MSRTTKEGKSNRRIKHKPRSPEIGDVIQKRHSFGRTEKILRRNRKTFTRLGNKIGRRLDKDEIKDQT